MWIWCALAWGVEPTGETAIDVESSSVEAPATDEVPEDRRSSEFPTDEPATLPAPPAPGTPLLRLSGRVMLDYVRDVLGPVDPAEPGFGIRRARVQAKLTPTDWLATKLDWNLETMVIHDLFVDLGLDAATLRLGQSKEPLTQAFLESSNYLPFAERPMGHTALRCGRMVGANLRLKPSRLLVEIAGGRVTPFDPDYGGSEGVAHVAWEFVDGWTLSASGAGGLHVAFTPVLETVSGHPLATLDASLTGPVGRAAAGLGVHLAPVRIDVEAMGLKGTGAAPTTVTSSSLQALWMLTGEARAFSQAVDPDRPLHQGPGALELGARIEVLTARACVDVDAQALTTGLTWFLHRNVKLPANLVRTWIADGPNETVVVLRMQVEG